MGQLVQALKQQNNACSGRPKGKNAFQGTVLTVGSSLVLLCACATVASVIFGYQGGGALGTVIALNSINFLNEAGTLLIASAICLLSFGLSTGLGAVYLFRFFHALSVSLLEICTEGLVLSRSIVKGFFAFIPLPFRSSSDSDSADGAEKPFTLDGRAAVLPKRRVRAARPEHAEIDIDDEDEVDDRREIGEVKILRRGAGDDKKKVEKKKPAAKKNAREEFQRPSVEFLVRGEVSASSAPKDKELISNSRRLEETLMNFRIGGKVVEVHPGPVITLYQFEPAPGVKVQKIITLADDLALSLKVASVRVYAPVPGQGTVGIEVPNAHREIVRLRDLIEAKSFLDPQFQIALALGKDTFGDAYITDLAKMPHLLIAGATGTGKSVCINSLLLSLLYRNTPDELRLILIDPKMLELSVYEDIPHLKAPVVTQAKRARGVLWWAVEEMERRYSLMKETGVRNLASYNSLAVAGQTPRGRTAANSEEEVIELQEKDVVSTNSEQPLLDRESDDEPISAKRIPPGVIEPLPRIVIVVDELADLMLTVGREIEELLTRLAQKARAAGIHLILATQRPSVNVITGLIKANFPSRVSFKVASRIDARTVMDTSGAEKLLGQGDMLFMSPGAGRPKRLHSPFVSDKEVHDVVDYLRRQGRPEYDAQIESMIQRMEESENNGSPGIDGDNQEYDALYDQAVNLVVEKGLASTSMVQRVFRIGYNRAARILETMEREGVVGPADGAKPRQVLVPRQMDI